MPPLATIGRVSRVCIGTGIGANLMSETYYEAKNLVSYEPVRHDIGTK